MPDKYAEWRSFRRECEMLFRGTYRTTPKEEKTGAIINWMGRDGQAIAATWTDGEMDAKFADVDELYKAFEDRFKPEQNEMLCDFQFRHLKRHEGKAADEYMNQRWSHSKRTFGKKKKLDKSGERALQIARNTEAMKLQKDLMTTPKQFDAVKTKENQYKQRRLCNYCGDSYKPRECPAFGKICKICGRKNDFAKLCKSKDQKKKKIDDIEAHDESSDEGWDHNRCEISEMRTLTFDSVTDTSTIRKNDFEEPGKRRRLMGTLETLTKAGKGNYIDYKIDTGADSNLLSIDAFRKIHPGVTEERVENSIERNTILEACNGPHIKQLGKYKAKLKFEHKEKICSFYIIPGITSLIELPDAEKLKLIVAKCEPKQIKFKTSPTITLTDILEIDEVEQTSLFIDRDAKPQGMNKSKEIEAKMMNDYADLFQEVGCMKGEVHIHLKEDAQPYQTPPRRMAFAMEKSMQNEL
ncbi:hypothetical protein CAPTEDRAFT_198925 [Capitella teleta]|uniref:Peptidase A2 domain-containing protein n=1 Tax=Capitella teleta TaxID=283909 RepID=R7UZD6_CAPTE|nr:hypothetical protein CAPTEDRAFT_198925 [Capitella teleta]|eukprot:ELU09322.1 hypothetical protein CAPTEDRAFT_198925 [Capitella teleta]